MQPDNIEIDEHYERMLFDLLDAADHHISNIKPSEWCENHRMMTPDISPIPGYFTYKNSPYVREIVDCLAADHPARVIAVMKGAQIGMALDESTPIPTPTGWKTMGELQIGDYVFDEHGEPCKVIKTTSSMINHKCFDVYFSDGSMIKADAQHLWNVWDEKKYETRKKITIDTETISKTFKHRQNRTRYAIENAKPLNLDPKRLKIDPYLLGLWLGDGSKNGNRITATNFDANEYSKYLDSIGVHHIVRPYKDQKNTVSIAITKPKNECLRGHPYVQKNINGTFVCYECSNQRYRGELDDIKHRNFLMDLKFYGIAERKRIPPIYLRASFDQRLELLKGLMDSDGHIAPNSQFEFYNSDFDLINDVFELVASLGLKPRLTQKQNYDCEVIPGRIYKTKKAYRISFKGFAEIPVARLERKLKYLKPLNSMRHSEITRRRIVNVVECESVPVRCITVDTPTHLYLAGKTMIPTHNSTGLMEAGIGWIISQNPGNILFLVGHDDLVKDASTKIDRMIDNSGIRHLIKSVSMRARKTKSGDTDKRKDFSGGYLKIGTANHKSLRNISMQYGFIDDFESMKGETKESGSTEKMIEQRFAAYSKKQKLFYISTPELKESSNIEPVFLKGDQRKYHIPCPCCGEFIVLEWECASEVETEQRAGMTWELDDSGELIPESVGYICQKCGGFFNDQNKTNWLLAGKWIPTAKPVKPGYYSYHISALYSPVYMYGWEHYVREYMDANPIGGERDEQKYKTFSNLCLGVTYEQKGEQLDANELQKNIRQYEVGTIPDKLSMNEGGGRIVLLTMAADLNGKLDDARLDWEIVGYNEIGATFSIDHGSIGTFIPKDPGNTDRARWSYQHGVQNSVWPVFKELLQKTYQTDTGRNMKIIMAGLDAGYMTQHAYQFVDATNNVVALKGKDVDKYTALNKDVKTYKRAQERPNLYLVEANIIKDRTASDMRLKWNPQWHEVQPPGFMNFPTPSGGKYLYQNYFSHFEAEHKVLDKDTTFRWLKKSNMHQNHLWDCRLYNYVVRDIFLDRLFRELKIQNGSWHDFVEIITGKRKK